MDIEGEGKGIPCVEWCRGYSPCRGDRSLHRTAEPCCVASNLSVRDLIVLNIASNHLTPYSFI